MGDDRCEATWYRYLYFHPPCLADGRSLVRQCMCSCCPDTCNVKFRALVHNIVDETRIYAINPERFPGISHDATG